MTRLVEVANHLGRPPGTTGHADVGIVPDVLPRPDRLDALDRALVARCADGEVPALRSLFDRHHTTVWGCAGVAASRPGAPAAEELTTGAFLGLWHHATAVLAGTRSVEAVLVTAVARLALGRPAVGPVARVSPAGSGCGGGGGLPADDEVLAGVRSGEA